MQIHISPTDGVPIYLQIVNQVKYLVSSGRLGIGEELPAIRVLAEKLLINPNTVARAYRELEMAGVVVKHRTTGTYVSGVGSRRSHATGASAVARAPASDIMSRTATRVASARYCQTTE